MFEIEESAGLHPGQSEKRVVDKIRNAALVCAYRGPGSTVTFTLEVGGKIIPFRATWSGRPAGFKSDLKGHIHWTIEPEYFGDRAVIPGLTIPKHIFATDRERTEAGLLAVRALIVFGFSYDGPALAPVSELTAEFDGRIYSMRDFQGG